MKLLYSAPNLLLVRHWKNVLELEGIHCIVKNENLSGAAGELPPTDCWPELWLINDKHYSRARQLLVADEKIQPPWSCSSCGELLEGQFDRCWNCGEYRNN